MLVKIIFSRTFFLFTISKKKKIIIVFKICWCPLCVWRGPVHDAPFAPFPHYAYETCRSYFFFSRPILIQFYFMRCLPEIIFPDRGNDFLFYDISLGFSRHQPIICSHAAWDGSVALGLTVPGLSRQNSFNSVSKVFKDKWTLVPV